MTTLINYGITNNGRDLNAKIIAGKKVEFVRIAVGSGELNTDVDITGFKNLINEVLSLNIVDKKDIDGGTVKLTAYFTSADLETDFWYREVGLFAFDPDSGQEVLYCYGNAGEYAEYIQKTTAPVIKTEKQASLIINCGNVSNITVKIDPNLVPTIDYIKDGYQALSEKSQANGYAPLDNDAKIPLQHLRASHAPFCFNSGPVDKSGEPALLEISEVTENEITTKTLTLKTPAVYTDGFGTTYNINEDLVLDITGLADGNYSIRVAENNGAFNFFALKDAKVYRDKKPPTNPVSGDLWQDLSVAPTAVYKYNENLEKIPSKEVEAGVLTLASESEVQNDPNTNNQSV